MRGRWEQLRNRLAGHRRAAIAIVFVAVLVTLAAGATYVTRPAPISPADLPTQTATQRWTIVDVAQQVDDGSVSAVTLGRNGAGDEVLLAQTRDGRYVAITSPASVTDAAAALVSLG